MYRIVSAALFFIPALVLAHSEGLSIEMVKEGYLIDIGHNSEFVEGGTVRFDLELHDDATKEPVGFTKAWVRITKEEQVIFAGSISQAQFGKPGLSIALMNEGAHSLFIRFEDDAHTLVEADLTFIVTADPEKKTNQSTLMAEITFLLVGLVTGLIGGRLFKK